MLPRSARVKPLPTSRRVRVAQLKLRVLELLVLFKAHGTLPQAVRKLLACKRVLALKLPRMQVLAHV